MSEFPDAHRDLLNAPVAKYGEAVRNIGDQPPHHRVVVTLHPQRINVTDLRWPR
jgi:hypothetical protein